MKSDSTQRIRLATIGLLIVALAALAIGCGPKQEAAPEPTATPKPPAAFEATTLATAAATAPTDVAPTTAASGGGSATVTPAPSTAASAAPSALGAQLAAMGILDAAGFHGMATDLQTAAGLFETGPVLGVRDGLDVLSGLGLHGLGEDLEKATSAADINSRTAGQIKNALAVIGALSWPDELQKEVAATTGVLSDLQEALVKADLAGAQHAAHEAHEVTHDLTSAAYEWLGARKGPSGTGVVAVLSTRAGLDAIGALGLHGLSSDLDKATSAADINSRTAGEIKNALAVIGAVAWPEDLQEEVAATSDVLTELQDALVKADLAMAQHAAHGAHETTHDLNSAAYEWLGAQKGSSGSGVAAVLGTRSGIDALGDLGLHGLSGDLDKAASAADINSRTAGQIKNALAVMGAVAWPEDVQKELTATTGVLTELQDALVKADLAMAQHAAHEAHDAGHDLTVAAYEWLGSQNGTELAGQLISSRYVSTVRNAVVAVSAAEWTGEMAPVALELKGTLTELEGALVRNDAVAAAAAVEHVHHANHDHSVGMYAMMANGQHMPMHGSMTAAHTVGEGLAGMKLMGKAGFHDLAETLDKATSADAITTRQIDAVKNALAIALAVSWPEAVAREEEAYQSVVKTLADALTRADLAAARTAAEAVHEVEHDFVGAYYEWLGTQQGTATDKGSVLALIDALDSAGLHAMQEAHAKATDHSEISQGDARTVQRVLIAARAIDWSNGSGAEAGEMMEALAHAHEAMVKADLAACQKALEEVHHAQHDFSKAVYAWLAS